MIHLVIKPVGRLGNRLFQYLSNEFIGNQIAEYSDVTIVKPGIDELNIPSTANYRDYEKVQPHFILKGNSIENQISEILNINERDVLVESYFTGLNLKYLHQIPDEIKKAIKFEPSSQLEHAGNIVAHIRGGDIWKN